MKIEENTELLRNEWEKGFPSWFVESGRMTEREVRRYSQKAVSDPVVQVVLEAVSGYVLIMNKQRQVLAANLNLLSALGLNIMESVSGLRIGEVLGCENSAIGPDGCGTSEQCVHCGAALSILSSQAEDRSVAGECVMKIKRNGVFECLNFMVRVTPIRVGRHPMLVFVFHDISSRKQKRILEQIFFHDLRNMIGGLRLWGEQMQELDAPEAAGRIVNMVDLINREIDDHACLMSAENGVLEVNRSDVNVGLLYYTLSGIFEGEASAKGKKLVFHPEGRNAVLRTDPDLLRRVLSNMIRNGLESAPDGGTVHVEFGFSNARPRFAVHNLGTMSPETQARVFQRGFTTKGGQGHGLGTYSMKLIGETWLKGEVGFKSTPKEGTTFYFLLPPA
jgi:hypothetical protein